MSTCSKAFTLHVDPDTTCVDWTTLSWPNPAHPVDPWAAVVAPGVATNNPAVPTLTAIFGFSLTTGDPFGAAGVSNSGVLTYNGPDCNCNLAYNITNVGAMVFPAKAVTITRSGWGPLLVNFDIAALGVGNHVGNIPFTIPDTLGVPRTVDVRYAIQVAPAPPLTSSASLFVLTTI